MNTISIERQFERMGARAKVHTNLRRNVLTGVSIDIGHDDGGEFFDIAVSPNEPGELTVLNAQPRLRHLLLMSRQDDGKHKFLCGHDERHWFVAAVPERSGASTVSQAFEALRPSAVRAELSRKHVRVKNRNRRRNEAFLRQGEWFFVPVSRPVSFSPLIILKDEPLRRGGGKPHLCEELVRVGGELVYVCNQYPNGVTEGQYRRLIGQKPELRHLHWITQRRNPGVFVRGRVRHSDHKTIFLDGWHEVLMNTETQAAAMRHVAFID